MNAQFKKGILELCVLSLIRRRDYYGYELVDEISQKFEISEGSIYPILRRLTDEKYFETYLQESTSGPPRKYYRITTRGKQAADLLIQEWNEFNKQVETLMNGDAR